MPNRVLSNSFGSSSAVMSHNRTLSRFGFINWNDTGKKTEPVRAGSFCNDELFSTELSTLGAERWGGQRKKIMKYC